MFNKSIRKNLKGHLNCRGKKKSKPNEGREEGREISPTGENLKLDIDRQTSQLFNSKILHNKIMEVVKQEKQRTRSAILLSQAENQNIPT